MAINRKKQMTKQGTASSGGAIAKFGAESKIIDSEFYSGKPRKHSKRAMQVVDRLSRRMVKKASACGTSGGGDVRSGSPAFYHPEFEPSTLLMPRERREINSWCRYFYKYDALVSTAIDAHAELPVSTIRMTMPAGHDKAKNKMIQEEYQEMCSTEGVDLFNKILQMGVEYYKLGNVIPYAQWSAEKNRWIKLTLLDPDFCELEKLQFTNYMRLDLVPNENLKRIVNNGPDHPRTGLLYRTIPQDIVQLISMNKSIPLNTDPYTGSHATHVVYKMADYDLWGTGLIERNFKPLVYKDRLRQSQDAIAARHLTPKHLIYAENAGNFDVDTIREQVDNAFADPDYAIITNFELHWDLIGTSQGLMTLDSEWNWINEELMIGLMINRSFLLGEGSYANGQTVLEVMSQRYSIYRERLEAYIIHYLFRPMAVMNDWAEYEPGTVKKNPKIRYLYPKIKWNKLNFADDTQHKQMLSQMVNQGQVDMETWLESFGLDPETVADRLKRFEGTPLDVNYFEVQRAIASEVGRVLAPAIAKIRADEMGIEIPQEEGAGGGGGFSFGDGTHGKMTKTSETRDQREHERNVKKIDHRKKKQKKLLELPEEKPKKPPRTDVKKPKLFEAEDEELEIQLDKRGIDGPIDKPYDSIPISDENATEEAKARMKAVESSRHEWSKRMDNLHFDSNTKRAALTLENEILSLNGSSDTKTRIQVIRRYLPQIFACKIKTHEPIQDRTAKAKQQFSKEISDTSYSIETKLAEIQEPTQVKTLLRRSIEGIFASEQ